MFGEEPQQQAIFHNVLNQPAAAKLPKNKRLTQEQLSAKRRRVWVSMCKKEIPKAAKQKASVRKEGMANLKKVMFEAYSQTCVKRPLQGLKNGGLTKTGSLLTRELQWEIYLGVWKGGLFHATP